MFQMIQKIFTGSMLFRIGIAFTTIITVVEVWFLILFRETWIDEYFLAFKSYLIMNGELSPFKDILVEYPPLFLPLFGLPQLLTGPSIYTTRIVASILFVVMIMLIFLIARRLGGKGAALLSVLCVLSNLFLVSNYTAGVLYSVTMVILLGLVVTEISNVSRIKKSIISGVFLGLLMLTRSNMLPAILIYIAYLFTVCIPFRYIVTVSCISFFVIILGYAPVLIYDWDLGISMALYPFKSFGLLASLPPSGRLHAFDPKVFLEELVKIVREYYPFFLIALSALITLLAEKKKEVWRFAQKERGFLLIVLFGFGLFLAHYFYWRIDSRIAYGNYFIPFIIMIGAVAYGKYIPRSTALYSFIGGLLFLSFAINIYRTDVFSSPLSESDLSRVARGGRFVEKFVPKGASVLTFDNSLTHVFAANRRTYPPLINRDFLYFRNASTTLVNRLHYYNDELLNEWLLNDADAVLLHKERWTEFFYRTSFYSEKEENPDLRVAEVKKIISDNYILIGEALNVYPRKYTEGNDGGTLQVYLKKN